MSRVLRPSDDDALRAELRRLHPRTELPVLFGGCVDDRSLTITGYVGTRSNILRNLKIDAECGLGGRAIAEQRPGAVQDYANSSHITHDYDYEVGTEAIESLMAVPIVVRGVTRGAIYGGLRANLPIGDVIAETMMRSSYALAREFEIRDEVDRRVAMLDTAAVEHGSNRDAQISEGLTESVLALGEIAANLEDMALSAQVLAVEAKLRALASPKPSANTPVANTVVLSPREREVMGYVALGLRNAEIAERLSLSVETIKTYMRNLMGKLDVRSRHEAVVEARRQGLIL
ncbi:DNA-binding response regulator [Rhodococcus sp. WS1]|uniref:Helix-turn-helix transcriptional regulator n=1 Tax=Rhodococcus erythropolis TaxID=1833 RepID=A0A0C2VK54_RHOER|nr:MULTISPECIES: response regulator transcription factor [Rhodococcus]MCD2152754.1 response regulator transcription factor [Rhodococcus cerastii]NRH31924.1 response regulator transcription factor [Rhodococcus sp. MS13]KAB2586740.1 helix-turn-helix transcriptional regulator [Rhodococcus erythropolis]KIM15098.1 LuxR family transcriptional regulator [Rhodococcus erythropolis]MBF7731802.1 response regulator transcription factor [Rhodococcus erythropolis]